MIRRLLLLSLPALLAAGCARNYGPSAGPSPSDEGWVEAGPMVARLYQGAGRLQISVNQPAHIAVFEIIPGRGVGLIYPTDEFEETRLVHGSEWLNPAYRSRSRHIFDAGLPFYQPYAGPTRFYLLVASRRPMYTSRFRHSPQSLRTALGIHYASRNEVEVLDRLVENILPPQPEEDWSTDILAVWSDPGFRDRYRDRLVQVTCADGSFAIVPLEFASYACRQPERRRQVPPLKPDSGATDTSSVVHRPGGRRPRPADPTGQGEVVDVDGAPLTRPLPRDRDRRILPPADEGGARIEPGRRPAEPDDAAESDAPVSPPVDRPARRERPDGGERPRIHPRSGGETGGSSPPREAPRASPPPSSPPPSASPAPSSPAPAPRSAPAPSSGGRSRPSPPR